MHRDHLIGIGAGLALGIGCILYGMQARAHHDGPHHERLHITIYPDHATGPTHTVKARLLPFPGMERYNLDAICETDEECDRLEAFLQSMDYVRR